MTREPRPAGVPLLPVRFRTAGYFLVVLGGGLGVARFQLGWRPTFLDWRVFALHSRFFEARAFTWMEKNVTVEVTVLLLLVGLLFVAFSRERVERAGLAALRLRALQIAVAFDAALLAALQFFVFGLSFAYVLAGNMFATLVFYVVVFRWSAARHTDDLVEVRPAASEAKNQP